MTIENKYYIPELSEFHVGFEYEESIGTNSDGSEDWSHLICHKNYLFDADMIDDLIREGLIRVKYLDRQDIESCGFNVLIDDNRYWDTYKLNGFYLTRNKTDGNLCVLIDNGESLEDNHIYFHGNIKNISVLKEVLEMIGVNYE